MRLNPTVWSRTLPSIISSRVKRIHAKSGSSPVRDSPPPGRKAKNRLRRTNPLLLTNSDQSTGAGPGSQPCFTELSSRSQPPVSYPTQPGQVGIGVTRTPCPIHFLLRSDRSGMPMTLPFQSMLKFWMWSGQPTGVHMFWMSRHCAQALSNVWCSVDGKAGSLPDDLHGPAPAKAIAVLTGGNQDKRCGDGWSGWRESKRLGTG